MDEEEIEMTLGARRGARIRRIGVVAGGTTALVLLAVLVWLSMSAARGRAEVATEPPPVSPEVSTILAGLADRAASIQSAYGEFTYQDYQDSSTLTQVPRYVTSASVRWAMDGRRFAEDARLAFSDGEAASQVRYSDGEIIAAYTPWPGQRQDVPEDAFEAPVAELSPSKWGNEFTPRGLWAPGATLLGVESKYDPAYESLGDTLLSLQAGLIGVEDFGGFRCQKLQAVTVRTEQVPDKGAVRITITQTWWIAADRGFAPVAMERRQDNEYLFDNPPTTAMRSTVHLFSRTDFAEYGSGIWLPREMTVRVRRTYVDGTERELRRASLKAISLHVNESVPQNLLQVRIPSGVRIWQLGQGGVYRTAE
jgi:hypothetical protein